MNMGRIISVDTNDVENLINNFYDNDKDDFFVKAGSSWSGENTKESFTNEWNKGIEIVICFKNVNEDDFIKMTIDDIEKYNGDLTIDDIEKYDEYRNISDLNLKIVDISDGREDVGYVEMEVAY